MKPLILYHAGCSDGFAAAWCAWRRFGDEAEYRAVQYGEDAPNDIEGRDVYILDFSYAPEVIEKMAGEAATITLLDHHRSAEKRFCEMWGRGGEDDDVAWRSWVFPSMPSLVVRLARDLSGAQMAYDYFGAGPDHYTDWDADLRELGSWPAIIIAYVADRDLWRWSLPDSREVNAYIRSLPFDFAAWDRFMDQDPDRFSMTIACGKAILQSQAREIERAVRRARRPTIVIPDRLVNEIPVSLMPMLGVIRDAGIAPMVVNVTENISEVLDELAKEPPHWAIGWYQDEKGRYLYSLRSSPEGPDVAKIAEAFGGGGHHRSAGFGSSRPLF